jgi:hypothetical protein
MFKDIHDQYWNAAGRMPFIVLVEPEIDQFVVGRVQV